jgi:hypothetical protein
MKVEYERSKRIVSSRRGYAYIRRCEKINSEQARNQRSRQTKLLFRNQPQSQFENCAKKHYGEITRRV